MGVDYTAKIIKGYKLPYDIIQKHLNDDTINDLCDEFVLHRLDCYSCDPDFIFGYPTGECVEAGDAIPISLGDPDVCRESEENNDLMLRAMSLFPGDLPHNYPKYYLVLRVY